MSIWDGDTSQPFWEREAEYDAAGGEGRLPRLAHNQGYPGSIPGPAIPTEEVRDEAPKL